jgi:transcriptional regulator with XRE-family HTH domain
MDKKKLGMCLAGRRRELGLKQEELASIIHVSSKTISKWERGLSSPDISFWESIADALEIELYDLLCYGAEIENKSDKISILILKKLKEYKRNVVIFCLIAIVSIAGLRGGYSLYGYYSDEFTRISRGEVIDIDNELVVFQEESSFYVQEKKWYAPKIIINRNDIQDDIELSKGSRLVITHIYKNYNVRKRGEDIEIRPMQVLEVSSHQ